MTLEIMPATLEHLDQVAGNARPEDVAELLASSGDDPAQVLKHGHRVSSLCLAGVVAGEAVCVVGVSPVCAAYGLGSPWMVGTTALDRHARKFARVSRPVVEEMNRVYPHLANFVDNRNDKAIRWLEWMGFKFYPPRPHGVLGLPFMLFERKS